MRADLIIVVFLSVALYRGRRVGFIRQAFATAGFIGGLIIGIVLQPYMVISSMDQAQRSLFAFLSTLGIGLVFLSIGEYIGLRVKMRTQHRKVNKADDALGIILAAATLLFSFWLLAAAISGLPFTRLNAEIDKSRVINTLNRALPDAPHFISDVAHLIDPNGFPRVFSGPSPTPRTDLNLPALGELKPAVEKTRDSVIKVEGLGCGGVVDGSGFIIEPGYVATNAHVVAGIQKPYVQDENGSYEATIIWFDPELDYAVLKVPKIKGRPIPLSSKLASAGSPAVVLGYPGGGGLAASPAVILEQITALGRNIYDRGNTSRDVYEFKGKVRQGNSGGPLINKNGEVIGVVFAQSASYPDVGYALTNNETRADTATAIAQNKIFSSGRCAAE